MGKNDEFSYRDVDVEVFNKMYLRGDIERFEYIGMKIRRDVYWRVN